MSLRDYLKNPKSILEDRFRIRIIPKPDNTNNIDIAKKGKTLNDMISSDIDNGFMVNVSSLNAFRTLSSDREYQYQVYDDMKADAVVAAALEMYADDATQYDTEGRIIWVESDDPDVAAFGNRLLDVLGIPEKAWSHIYSLCLYGDLYLETFKNTSMNDRLPDLLVEPLQNSGNVFLQKRVHGSFMEEYIEEVANPANIYDLQRKGKTVGFIEIPRIEEDTTKISGMTISQVNIDSQYGNDVNVLDPDKYVHIMLAAETDRFPETVTLTSNDGKVGSEELKLRLKVKRGKSILQDVYKIYQELKLMEDSLLLNRITRSSIIRLLQVEVGDMPKSQVTQLIKRLKDKIEQKNIMDTREGKFKSQASPGPIENIIYTPKHDGKGEITMSNIGGDIDVKSIADIDYFSNKFFGGIKIPKAYLGMDMDGTGLSNGGSLTRLDSRYARTIKRVQNAYIAGITTLINLFAIDKGLEESHVNNFTVKMTSPATQEDQDRDDTFNSKIGTVSSFLDLISQEDMSTPETRKQILLYFITNFMNRPEITEILEKDETAEKATEENSEEPSEPSFDAGGGDFGGDDFGDDFGGDEDFGDEGFDEGETGEDEGTALDSDVDLGANSDDANFGNFEEF